jgi:glycosyltransferase involved in cell wall biosynthesis
MRWLSYFPEVHNVHLTKDVGLLPFYMQEVCGYHSALMGRFPERAYPALEGEVRGLETIPLPDDGYFTFLEKSALRAIRKLAPETDVLQLSHLSRHTILYGLLYKRYNPNGFLYLKLDAYNAHLAARKTYSKSPVKEALLQYLSRRFFKAVDLISIENKAGVELALRPYPEWKGKLIYSPVGANNRFIDSHFDNAGPGQKVILSVGRVGSPEKNYELLARALPYLKLGDWEMQIIGPVSTEFQSLWEQAFHNHPDIAEKITFLGNISDRIALYKHYREARIFFLPSRVESFGIVFVEALYFGSIPVGHSGMYAFDDISGQGRYGTTFQDDDPERFAAALHEAMRRSDAEPGLRSEIRTHAAAHFSWSGIAAKLGEAIEIRKKSRIAADVNV